MKFKLTLVGVMLVLSSLVSCGGGGSSSSSSSSGSNKNVDFEGEVEEGNLAANLSGTTAAKNVFLPGVQVCALGICSVTDQNGKFKFQALSPSTASAVEFSINASNFSDLIPIRIAGSTQMVEVVILHDPSVPTTRALEVKLDGVVDPGQSDGNFNDGD